MSHLSAVAHGKVIREFNRVMENDIATEFMELWTVLVPKILDLAENEETASVKRF